MCQVRGGEAFLVSTAARATAIATGHPALKLVLLSVASSPGWPTEQDVVTVSELDPGWAADALAELVRTGVLTRHTGVGPDRFGLAVDDGWGYDRGDTAAEIPVAVPPGGDIGGYAFSTRGQRATA